MMYSSSPMDAMIHIGDTYIRASQIESIDIQPTTSTIGRRNVTIRTLSGENHEFVLLKSDAENIPKMVMGA